jgi:hypothetical protein
MGQTIKQIHNRNYCICEALKKNESFMADVNKTIKLIATSSEFKRSVIEKQLDGILVKYIGQKLISEGYKNFIRSLVLKKDFKATNSVARLNFQIVYPEFKILGKTIPNDPKETGMYIKIYPHTTSDDVKKAWPLIQQNAREAALYNPQDFQWPKHRTHSDDLGITVMDLYVREKEKLGEVRQRFAIPIYKKIQEKLPKNYRKTSIENIKRCISKYRYLERYFKPPA